MVGPIYLDQTCCLGLGVKVYGHTGIGWNRIDWNWKEGDQKGKWGEKEGVIGKIRVKEK